MTYIPVQRRERRARFDQERPPLVEPSGIEGRHLLAILLGIILFFFLAFLSFRQQSEQDTAAKAQRVGIAAITEVDLLIESNREDMELQAEAGETDEIALPNYPFPVFFSPDEVDSLSDEEMRDRLLDESAAQVYEHGLSAFDSTGQQDLSEFSANGAAVWLLGNLTDSNNSSANILTIGLFIIAAGLAVGVVLLNEGNERFKVLGIAMALGAVPGLIVSLVARFFAGGIIGGDPFAEDLANSLSALIEIPIRNYAAVFVLGVFTFIMSPLLVVLARRFDADHATPATPRPREDPGPTFGR